MRSGATSTNRRVVDDGRAADVTSTDADVTRCITQRMACTLRSLRAQRLLVAAATAAGGTAAGCLQRDNSG